MKRILYRTITLLLASITVDAEEIKLPFTGTWFVMQGGDTVNVNHHMHMQNTPAFNQGTGINIRFSGIDVELSGKKFEDVDWPLLRGLFVSNTIKAE